MFTNGLHDRVDIFPLLRNMSNRKVKGDIKVDTSASMTNVPCRIIRDEKVLFDGELKLTNGTTIKDLRTGLVYEIGRGKQIYGLNKKPHHSSYQIRIKAESERHGN